MKISYYENKIMNAITGRLILRGNDEMGDGE
jgi:hypothetical protein